MTGKRRPALRHIVGRGERPIQRESKSKGATLERHFTGNTSFDLIFGYAILMSC